MRILFGCLLFLSCAIAYAEKSIDDFARAHYDSLHAVIDASLQGNGLAAFEKISARVANNIQWSDGRGLNRYLKAHQRSYPYLKRQQDHDMPSFVFLIAYLESGWRADVGNLDHDYGYWQMIPEVLEEIQQLPEASLVLSLLPIHKIRSDEDLSTEAAFIHLHRYQFYFQHVAGFDEAESWMFTLVAFNWGAGNVKRMLLAMQAEGKEQSFSAFYDYLVKQSQQDKADKSMRVAVEYIPNLWNIALLLNRKS